MRPGQPERHTHDYFPHGTTSLFAALNVAPGEVIGRCHRRHRHQEFQRFLEQIDHALPEELGVSLRLVLVNYAAHKTPKGAALVCPTSRFHVHFTPTSASWLNQVERFSRRSRRSGIRGGVQRG
jgi:hypothetical protein